MVTFPVLFKKNSNGSIQFWSIGVDKNVIVTEFGQKGGKVQHGEETISEGKNVGRSNETSPEEQALAEARSKWEAKIKKGYVEDINRAVAGEKDIEGGFDPMLAHKFADHGHKIRFPAYVQPKLNGHRCLAVIEDGTCSLWSRTRKPITSCPHIVEELERMFPTGSYQFDGELYNHAYKDSFEELASLIRQEVPHEDCTEIEYWVYDKNVPGTFKQRSDELHDDLLDKDDRTVHAQYIVLVGTTLVKDEDELTEKFGMFLASGYEGAMVRNTAGLYVGKRSYDLQKVKEFHDEDYSIVGINEGRGSYAGCGIFVCQTPEGKTFDVKMRGPKERLTEFLNDHSLWKDKKLVVKYQYISKYGVPIFPIGERFSDK